jgi:hypothetical protein
MLRRVGAAAVAPEPAEPLFEEDSDNDVVQPDQPAVVISPVKARAVRRGIANKTDIEVWGLPDAEIIGEHMFFHQYGAHSCVFRRISVYMALKCVRSF